MARIAGVDLPDHKKIDIALTYIYGIGRSNVEILVQNTAIDRAKKVGDLSEEEIGKIQKVLDENFKIGGDLKGEENENIKRLKQIGSYRGLRHIKGLPVAGQRTRSNARTKRGKRKTIGALRKEIRAKLQKQQSAQKSSSSQKK